VAQLTGGTVLLHRGPDKLPIICSVLTDSAHPDVSSWRRTRSFGWWLLVYWHPRTSSWFWCYITLHNFLPDFLYSFGFPPGLPPQIFAWTVSSELLVFVAVEQKDGQGW